MIDRAEDAEGNLEKHRVCEEFEESLRRLAMNMLRVVAGAGEPYRLLRDMHRCVLSAQSYRECHNELPTSFQIADLLNCTRNLEGLATFTSLERPPPKEPRDYELAAAATEIRQGSLRVVAAQWGDSRTVLINAERLFENGIRRHEKARERLNAAYLGRRGDKK
ncbi:hypothetical protein [Methylocystis echinoides]|uniref:Uncharacterized protein n=1 Tax=Methylocystis echinoides TaxID=29468 RepID=A0A9W6LQC3_9HYPH|nr:hypothetical protein [Methylocystis echinoides]GLI91089.1 hypothetical protein LMG27198_00810 [Methylocystis echinoides]